MARPFVTAPTYSPCLMANHIVWDWNGTLWDDLPQVHAATNAALAQVGGPRLTLPEYVGLFTRPLPVFYRRVLGRDITAPQWDLVHRTFMTSYQEELHRAQLAAEAITALETVVHNGGTQSILSLYPHQALNSLVSKLGIGHFFSHVQGLQDTPDRSKVGMFRPHLMKAAPDVAAHRIVMIGDTDDDLFAAQAAGSTGVLINHHGYHPLGDPTLESFFADGLLDALRKSGLRVE